MPRIVQEEDDDRTYEIVVNDDDNTWYYLPNWLKGVPEDELPRTLTENPEERELDAEGWKDDDPE